MKILLFLTGLLVSCSSAFGQKDSVQVWNKWCSRIDTNLLFTAAYNVIMVHSPTLKAEDIVLKSLDNSLKIGIQPEIKGDTLSTMAMPYPTKAKMMRLAIINKKTKKTIKTVNFTCADVPPLVAKVGKIQGDEAERKFILSQGTIRTVFPNSLYCYPYKIKQYTFKISTPTGSATIPVNGFFIPKEVLQQIKDAPVNTVAEFTDIKVTCPDCVTKEVSNIKLKIK